MGKSKARVPAPAPSNAGRLRLPPTIAANLFDLDGVLTQTATVHARAWKEMFDSFLRDRRGQRPFDLVRDYDSYVDGKPREDGVRSFLESRHLNLDDRQIEDLAARKDRIFLGLIHRDGVMTYEGSVRFARAARAAGVKAAVVTSSKHCDEVLRAAGLQGMFDAQVDGNLREARQLRGKPAPDTYLEAARMVGVTAASSAVFEDALAGVEAGRAGGFGCIVGVDRIGQRQALLRHGASIVVNDLAELIPAA